MSPSLEGFQEALTASLAKANLVPGAAESLISIACRPTTILNVKYGDKAVELGTFFRAGECKEAPTITFTAEADAPHNGLYTLILTDPDAPTPDEPKFAFWRHWVVSGLRSSGSDDAVELTKYLGPGPKDDSKPHRYLFLLYREPEGSAFSKEDVGGEEFVQRRSFNPTDYAMRHRLILVGVNWMYCAGDGLHARNIERTVAFPCGHIFGARCVSKMFAGERNRSPACPVCGYQMSYTGCGHAIAPTRIPINGTAPVRDLFALTVSEGGQLPRNCKQCRWKAIETKLSYALSSECVICRQKVKTGFPADPIEHDAHRTHHLEVGIRAALRGIVELLQPILTTRKTESADQKAVEDDDRRAVNLSLLHAMVLTDLESTVWLRTPTTNISKEQQVKHDKGFESIQDCVIAWLAETSSASRRTW
ncbi:PEBP-like protein [Xylariaceae sp. FL1019]|nr:PEBP-like protein [Xylariaceae sp. FL1019]